MATSFVISLIWMKLIGHREEEIEGTKLVEARVAIALAGANCRIKGNHFSRYHAPLTGLAEALEDYV